jgi:glycine cleavage system aminomethyltransferase T
MRPLQLHDRWMDAHAAVAQRFGTEIVSIISDPKKEYSHVRDAVGISDFSHMQKFNVPEEKGLDFLDNLLAGNVAKVRFGRVLHTFLADNDGFLVADCFMANNDEELVLLCESIVNDAALKTVLNNNGAQEAGLVDLSENHVVLGIDGYKAWAVVKDLFGADIVGLPYLSIERFSFEGENVRLFRAGKTSEFGYLIMAPAQCAESLFLKCNELSEKYGGGLCGLNIHNNLRLEGRFFNIFAEGLKVRDPLALGLQWMIDFDKEKFLGRDAILKRRSAGLTHKIIGISLEPGAGELKPGAPIFNGPEKVSEVVASCFSYVLNRSIGLALFPVAIAYSGLSFNLGAPNGPVIKTISMPPIMPKSLSVKLDEM